MPVSQRPSEDPNVFVEIPLSEYEQLKEDQAWLSCLEAAGVDNWDGWSFALQIKRERERG
jgi:hypothetical protein